LTEVKSLQEPVIAIRVTGKRVTGAFEARINSAALLLEPIEGV